MQDLQEGLVDVGLALKAVLDLVDVVDGVVELHGLVVLRGRPGGRGAGGRVELQGRRARGGVHRDGRVALAARRQDGRLLRLGGGQRGLRFSERRCGLWIRF